MSQNPQKRNKDSKEVAEDSVEQSIAIGEENTESIEVTGEREEKDTTTAAVNL